MPAETKTSAWSPLLIVGSGLFGLFNAIAIATFLWAGTGDPKSDIGLTSVSVIVAWLGDFVALVLAIAGGIVGRRRAAAILWALLLVALALGSAGVATLAWLARAIAETPVPIH